MHRHPTSPLSSIRLALTAFLLFALGIPSFGQAAYQGTYIGYSYIRLEGAVTQPETANGTVIAEVANDGSITLQGGGITGTVDSAGTINWVQPNGFYLTAGNISGGTLHGSGSTTNGLTTTHTRIELKTGGYDVNASLDGYFTVINPKPPLHDSVAIIHDGTRFVVLGEKGAIHFSEDGQTWQSRHTGSVHPMTALAYGSGTYVAVGENNTLLTSTDLENWVPRASGIGQVQNWHITTVTFHDGRFYIGNMTGGITRSSDATGATWEAPMYTSNAIGPLTNPLLRAMGSRLYLVAKGYGQTRFKIHHSTNGTTFTEAALDASAIPSYFNTNPDHLVHGNGVHLINAYGYSATSTDGVNFTARNNPDAFSFVGFDGERFIARTPGGTNAKFYHSTNGVTWTEGTRDSLTNATGVAHHGSLRIATGALYLTRRSTDGLAWEKITSSDISADIATNSNELRVTYGNGLYILHGIATVVENLNFITRDGLNWTPAPTKRSIAFANGIFFSGDQISLDGITWIDANLPLNQNETIKFVASDGDTLLAISIQNRVFTSDDGFTWQHVNAASPAPGNAHTVVGANGQWIALATGGQYYHSPDNGATWTSATKSNATLNGAAYGNGRWVIVANNGHIYTGSDPASLTSTGPTLTQGGGYDSVVFIDGKFFVRRDNFGTYFVSDALPGSTWEEKYFSGTVRFYGMASGPDFSLITGSNSTVIRAERNQVGHPVLTTQPPATVTLVQDGTLQLQAGVIGDPDLTYRWFRNGLPLENVGRVTGADTTALTITDIRGNDAGTYHLLVTNPLGTVVTRATQLTVNPKPLVVTPPLSLTKKPGADATFTVQGSPDTTAIQWFHNGQPISGATSATLTLSNLTDANAGLYEARLTNQFGDIFSPPASLSITHVASGISADGPYNANIPALNLSFTRSYLGYSANGIEIRKIHEYPDGKILVGGQFSYLSDTRHGLMRLNADGTLDTSFAFPLLRESVSNFFYNASVEDFGFLSDGHIVVVLSAAVNYGQSASLPISTRILLLDANGNPDFSFNIPFPANAQVGSLAIDSQDRIVLAGYRFSGTGNNTVNIARYQANGTPDASFDGKLVTTGISNFIQRGVKLLPDGKLVAVGQNNSSRLTTTRLTSSGTQDPTFTKADLGTGSTGVKELKLHDDGGFLISGGIGIVTINSVQSPRRQVALFHADGTLEPTVNSATNPAHTYFGTIYSSEILPDNSLLFGGSYSYYDNLDYLPEGLLKNLAQFEASGTVMMMESQQLEADFAPSQHPFSLLHANPSHSRIYAGRWITTTSFPNAPRILRLTTGSGPLPGAPAPAITHQSSGTYAEPGDSVTFAVSAVGGALSFQWSKNGQPIPGKTGPSLDIHPVGIDDAATYTVAVTDGSTTVYSSEMILTVRGAASTPTFSSWKSQYSFPPGEEGFNDDPAGDGVANGFKYLFGLDPNVPAVLQTEVPHPSGQKKFDSATINSINSGPGLPAPGTEGGKSYQLVSVRLPADMKGLSFEIQATTNLVFGNGSAQAHQLGEPVTDGDALIHSFYLTPATEDSARLFWRLEIGE
ncbi:hypothetical protein OVA24_08840 [Luteolibacter sp. SL250]|uniref:immunoglobulin domain-containing protein n=1 Tax=Luteolibacter sp. SL250 TaxID=2995170 RepID=UPI0022700BB3|nr:immunoglobulin domain-containing protein [Luteolibacter sp. SL250]WAC21489.1 hypothetical protein OVA24_08840 [Luteolibacter sp. SL250]